MNWVRFWLYPFVVALLINFGCGGGGGGSTPPSPAVLPPSNLSYANPTRVATVGVPIVMDWATRTGVGTFSVSPALPSGIGIDTISGTVSGTPVVAAPTTNYTVTMSNSAGSTTANINLTVNPSSPSNLSYSLRGIVGVVGTPIANLPPTVSGVVTSFTSSPALPAGIYLDPVTGVLSGTPTVPQIPIDFVITARNITGSENTGIRITVNPTGSDLWFKCSNLLTSRMGHTAITMPNGMVFVAGGQNANALSDCGLSAELLDPNTNIWSYTASMSTKRVNHTATLLGNGKVLVVSGGYPSPQASCELYSFDSTTMLGTWDSTGSLSVARRRHLSTLLGNGKVLVCGGYDPTSSQLSSAELYDPLTGSWSSAGAMSAPRSSLVSALTILSNGKVLVTGGLSGGLYLRTSDLYDPSTNTWTTVADMLTPRSSHAAITLPNGKVLVCGGSYGGTIASAEIYDPINNTWTSAASMPTARQSHFAAMLPNGKVFITGGLGSGSWLSTSDLYDPDLNQWTTAAGISLTRSGEFAATILPNGRLMITGGANNYGIPDVDVYFP